MDELAAMHRALRERFEFLAWLHRQFSDSGFVIAAIAAGETARPVFEEACAVHSRIVAR